MIKVTVCGAAGKMGSTVVKAVSEDKELELAGAVDRQKLGEDAGQVAGVGNIGIKISDDLASTQADVIVDFTNSNSAEENVIKALENGKHAVVGTTGLTDEQITNIKNKSAETGKNIFIAPNFAIGAVLMMELAKKAAKHMDNVEIIELHHNQKADAPSGTAIKTAKELAEIINLRDCPPTAQLGTVPSPDSKEKEILPGSRGGKQNNIRIHSVRLPGLVAHQEVIFGAKGQTLTIRHDSTDRTSFMPGVVAAIKSVADKPGVTIGLENLLDI